MGTPHQSSKLARERRYVTLVTVLISTVFFLTMLISGFTKHWVIMTLAIISAGLLPIALCLWTGSRIDRVVKHVATLDPIVVGVQKVSDIGKGLNMDPVIKVKLRPKSRGGKAIGYRTISIDDLRVPRLEVDRVFKGALLVVRHDPELPDYVLVDWKATRLLQSGAKDIESSEIGRSDFSGDLASLSGEAKRKSRLSVSDQPPEVRYVEQEPSPLEELIDEEKNNKEVTSD